VHTYHKRYGEDENGDEASTWVVGFVQGDPGPNLPIAEFMTEEDAAAYVNHLNGGGTVEVSPVDARKALAGRDEKIRKAKADKEIKALEEAAKAAADAKAAEVKATTTAAHEDKNDKAHAKAAAHK
jgi:hypothetical protein